ncbi:MAG: DUF4396 domain-containing protein [Patescibacteria group bacterium]|nr:DUF4396 domain-containing protein [Patescibacteria group bacterium]MDE1965677.1 DUF4396 domain-containing protein [Patescibacteria group bacterium]
MNDLFSRLDDHTRAAIRHTLHCLLGCSIGEVLGMSVTTLLGWAVVAKVAFSIPLAFLFGYLLTSSSMRRKGMSWASAAKAAFATDTVSIISMETVDSAFLLLIPGAMGAYLGNPIYWYKLFASLIAAFIITVPVNRYFIARNPHRYHQHH